MYGGWIGGWSDSYSIKATTSILFNPSPCVRRVCQGVTATGRWTGEEQIQTSPSLNKASTARATACSLGWNDKSWSLYCSEDKYSFVHKNQSTDIAKPRSSRVGVYVDQIKGTLAFYSVSDSMNLLHRVQTTFIEPLYPAFSVWGFGSSVKLV